MEYGLHWKSKTNLNIISIQVKSMIFIVEDLSRVLVPSIASHIISQHEYYPLIGIPNRLTVLQNQKVKNTYAHKKREFLKETEI